MGYVFTLRDKVLGYRLDAARPPSDLLRTESSDGARCSKSSPSVATSAPLCVAARLICMRIMGLSVYTFQGNSSWVYTAWNDIAQPCAGKAYPTNWLYWGSPTGRMPHTTLL